METSWILQESRRNRGRPSKIWQVHASRQVVVVGRLLETSSSPSLAIRREELK